MKRMLAALLLLCLMLSLSSCKDEDPAPASDPEPVGLTPYELWEQLRGVWMNDDQKYHFATFSTDGPDLCHSVGILFSEFSEGGVFQEYGFRDGIYSFVIHVDEVPATEMDDARPAHDFSVQVKLGEEPGRISMTDSLANDVWCSYSRVADRWEDLDFNEMMIGPAQDPEALWKQLAGVWVTVDHRDDTRYFTEFSIDENGEPRFFTGIPFSGYGMANAPSKVYRDESTGDWVISIVLNGEEQLVQVNLDGFATGRILMTNVAGFGDVSEFVYMCDKLENLSIDELFEL